MGVIPSTPTPIARRLDDGNAPCHGIQYWTSLNAGASFIANPANKPLSITLTVLPLRSMLFPLCPSLHQLSGPAFLIHRRVAPRVALRRRYLRRHLFGLRFQLPPQLAHMPVIV